MKIIKKIEDQKDFNVSAVSPGGWCCSCCCWCWCASGGSNSAGSASLAAY